MSDTNDVNRLYRTKARDSFKTRFNLLLYYRIRVGNKDAITTQELDQFKIADYLSLANHGIQST